MIHRQAATRILVIYHRLEAVRLWHFPVQALLCILMSAFQIHLDKVVRLHASIVHHCAQLSNGRQMKFLLTRKRLPCSEIEIRYA